MDFLKRHLFLILCGVGAAAGIGLAATGMRAMPKVKTELAAAATVYNNLEGLSPVNPRSIEAENQRIAAILDDRAKVLDSAKQLYRYEPLVEGVFPNGPPDKRLESERNTTRRSELCSTR